MSNKKYYWLKLHKDFFKQHEIRIIESMENGKDYILFYLKLLVESVSHEGFLRFSDLIPYNEQMLASITNTNIDVVRSAMKLFQELNMIEVLDDETIYMAEVDKMIGSETEWAEKKRAYRLAQKDNVETKKDNVRQEIRDKRLENRDTNSINTIVEIVDYLNSVCGTKYNPKTKNTVKHINARLNEGYTVDDFKTVIDKKAAEWKRTSMEQYLRPDTLFGTKFESYLNQNIVDQPKTNYKRNLMQELANVDIGDIKI